MDFLAGGGNLGFHINGASSANIGVPFTPIVGFWYHVAVTRSGSTYKFYVDGTQIGGDQSDSVAVPDAAAPLTLGHAEAIPSLNGFLDEVEIFNRALSATEISSIAGAGAFGKCRCTPPPEGMISWWPAEGNMDDIQDGNNLSDGTGNGVGYAAGKVGQAFTFDGTQFLTAGDPANLALTGTEVTIDGWIKPVDDTQGVLFGKSVSGGNDYCLFIFNDRRLTGFINTDNGGEIIVGGTYQPPVDGWTHVALTYDGATVKIYANGIEVNSAAKTGNLVHSNSPFHIGGRFAEDLTWKGSIDEVEVFDQALSADDIAALYNAGSAGKCRPCTPAPSGMTDWWPGDGNADNIQGNHDGTLHNGATFEPGKVGAAFRLDGVDDYVDVGDIDLPVTFTIDAWVNPASLSSGPIVISSNNGSYYLQIGGAGELRARVVNAATDETQYQTGGGVVSTGTWQHITVTYDGNAGANEKFLFYVNGINVPATASVSADNGGTPVDSATTTRIGLGPVANYFNGLIDEVEIFSRVLSGEEVGTIYDAGSGGKCKPAVPVERQLANISSRASVGTGDNVAIAGFIVRTDSGSTALPQTRGTPANLKRVLIRGRGPSLEDESGPITGRLMDTVLELHAQNGALIVQNDDWMDATNASDIAATGLAPSDDTESAILRDLASDSNYTAILRGKDPTTGDPASGIGIVEVFDLEENSDTHLANISTRAQVLEDDDVLIGGFIVHGDMPERVLLRARGPSLPPADVPNPLDDPVLELRDTNGNSLRRTTIGRIHLRL